MKSSFCFLLFLIPQIVFAQKVITLSINQPPEFGFSVSKPDTTIVKGRSVVLGTDLIVFGGSDQSTDIKRYNGNYNTTVASCMALGTGKSNTSIIVSALGTGDYAASLCSQLTLNGYDDWFLPSKEELNLLFQLRTEGKLNDYDYWSSTESGGTGFGSGAWYGSKYFSGYGTQNVSARVRAIRAF